MALVNATDKDGNVFKMHSFRGKLFSPNRPLDNKGYDVLLKLQARDDDVIVCGYPKCGTHWMKQVAWMLLSGSTDYVQFNKTALMLENVKLAGNEADYLSSYDDAASPRVMSTHLPYAMLPPDFITKKTKILYLCRNPKDVAVSYYNTITRTSASNYHGRWDGFLGLFQEGQVPCGSFFDELAKWQNVMERKPETPILIVYYEDTKEDFMKQARRLCDFFDISRDDEFLTSVYKACSFDRMKEDVEKHGQSHPQFPKDLSSIYRKGKVGDWKNWFTVAQNELFDEIFHSKLNELKYEFKYE